MPFDRFLIAPFNSDSGLDTSLRPWLIPDNAFAQCNNAYVFRGRVRKRFGTRLMGTGWDSTLMQPLNSRVAINLGNTNGAGALTVTVPGNVFGIGQAFAVITGTAANDTIFTVATTGAPATLLASGPGPGSATYNTTTGVLTVTGATAASPVFFYPSTPIMGIWTYQNGAINAQPTFAFDTQFAYTFTGGMWVRSGTVVWHGTDLNFFDATTFRGLTPDAKVMFVTNFNATIGAPGANDDPMYSFNGTTWASFSPFTIFLTAGNFVQTCRLIVSFKNRLLLLNTIEQDSGNTTNTSYVNRCRYSHNGSPFANNAWLEPNNTNAGANADGAGFIDCPTEEQIISAEFIKDRLIVYFERSTWELAYRGDQVLPFVWQKINTELGAESQQGTVPFDKVVLGIGNTGVHACNGANVERIDNKIPDQIFQLLDKSLGVQRVAGIRDYFAEMVYWAFPSADQNPIEVYPTKVLVYNYRNSTWSLNDDCFTAFGYFEEQTTLAWQDITWMWETWNQPWGEGENQANFRQILGGNQQGFITIVDTDESRNASAMQLTQMATNGTSKINLTIVNHTLSVGDYIALDNIQGSTLVPNAGYTNIFPVVAVSTVNVVTIANVTFTGAYTGGGVVTRVSNIQILSKQWNPYNTAESPGNNFFLARIDFGVEKTSAGQITVDYFPSASEVSMLGSNTGAIMGTGILETSPYSSIYPLEQFQERLWHPLYFQTTGECIQIFMSFSSTQIIVPAIAYSDFELDGMVLHCSRSSVRLQ